MFIPKINPDEFGPGYLIRLGLANGITKQKEVTKSILNYFPEITEHQNIIPYLLSVVSGLSVEDYCQQHTLLPIHRSITNIEENTVHGSLEYEYGVFRLGHFGLIKYFKICKSCIKEDLDYLGYSYFRRSHQIPGAHCCTKHSNSESGILYSAPLTVFCNPDHIDDVQLNRLDQYNNSNIDCIQLILDGLCHFNQPTNPNNLTVAMQAKAKELGMRWCANGQSALFSDFYVDQLPKNWLDEVGISTSSKVFGKRSSSIDGVLSIQEKHSQAMLYITALAILFGDSDQVLSLVNSAKNSVGNKPKSLKKFEDEYWRSDEFMQIYLSNLGNRQKLAKHLGVCNNVMLKGIKIAQLPCLGRTYNSAFKALELFYEGMPLHEASSTTGFPLDKLEQLLRKAFGKLPPMVKTTNDLSSLSIL